MKEKQIEEIIKDIFAAFGGYAKWEEDWQSLAEAVCDAGYRKQSEGEWVDQYNGKYDNPIYVCSLCRKGTLLTPEIDNLGNMKMTQALSPFCPHCGAKMKGGAEE